MQEHVPSFVHTPRCNKVTTHLCPHTSESMMRKPANEAGMLYPGIN